MGKDHIGYTPTTVSHPPQIGKHAMTLMFDKESVEEAGHPLARLLRLIFYRKGVSLDDFSTLWAEHGHRLDLNAQMTNTYRNNARKTMSRNEMTFRFFHYILLNILHLEVEEIRVVVRNEKGERVVLGSKDPIE
jgi:hypothetical protein